MTTGKPLEGLASAGTCAVFFATGRFFQTTDGHFVFAKITGFGLSFFRMLETKHQKPKGVRPASGLLQDPSKAKDVCPTAPCGSKSLILKAGKSSATCLHQAYESLGQVCFLQLISRFELAGGRDDPAAGFYEMCISCF